MRALKKREHGIFFFVLPFDIVSLIISCNRQPCFDSCRVKSCIRRVAPPHCIGILSGSLCLQCQQLRIDLGQVDLELCVFGILTFSCRFHRRSDGWSTTKRLEKHIGYSNLFITSYFLSYSGLVVVSKDITWPIQFVERFFIVIDFFLYYRRFPFYSKKMEVKRQMAFVIVTVVFE